MSAAPYPGSSLRAILTARSIAAATIAAVLPLIGTSACVTEHACTGQAFFGLVIAVKQSPAGSRVCDATVAARDGTFSEILTKAGTARDCTYSGAAERPGTYTIDVASGAKTRTVDSINVTADECHVMTRQIMVILDP